MKVIFIGTVDFSYFILRRLLEINADVVGVCTKESSSFNSDYSDLKPITISNNIPYLLVENINSKKAIQWIKKKEPDVIFCIGWSALIKTELLELAPLGVIGYHPAALPKNRGRHPIIWALALGLKESASTFFFMEEGADNGDIISQERFSIEYMDNAMSIYEKIKVIAYSQIEYIYKSLKNNTYKRIKQDDSKANIWRKRSKKDGLIDFRMSSRSIYNLIRALGKPYVGAYVEYKKVDVIVWEASEYEFYLDNIEPGKVINITGGNIIVKCGVGAIKLTEHEFNDLIPKIGDYL